MLRYQDPDDVARCAHGAKGLGLLTRTGALYVGDAMDTTVNSPHCYKIYITIEGEFHLYLGSGTSSVPCRGVIISPDQPHRVKSCGAVLGVFFLIPETDEGRAVSSFLDGKTAAAIPQELSSSLVSPLRSYLRSGCSVEEAGEVSSYLFNNLAPPAAAYCDRRVMLALEYLNSALWGRVMLSDVAAAVSISPSRLEHLFREQVGIPIGRYILWVRLKEALKLMGMNMQLTEVAHLTGFFDSAHFSRTFRRMLGLSPSSILRSTNLHVDNVEGARAGLNVSMAGVGN